MVSLVGVKLHSHDGAGGAPTLEGTGKHLSTAQGVVAAWPREGGEDAAMAADPALGALKAAVMSGWVRMPARRTYLHRCSGNGGGGDGGVPWHQGPFG